MTPSDPRLGVVGDEQLAASLRSMGLDVVSAPAFDKAATAVSSALRTGHLSAVLVFDSDAAPSGTHLWARTTASKAPMAILRDGPASANLPEQDRATEVSLPADLAFVLAGLGVEAPSLAGLVIGDEAAPAVQEAAPKPDPDLELDSMHTLAAAPYAFDLDDLPVAEAEPVSTAPALLAPVQEVPEPVTAPKAGAGLDDLFGSYAQSPMSRRSAPAVEDELARAVDADLWSTSTALASSPAPAQQEQLAAGPLPVPPPTDDLWSRSSSLGGPAPVFPPRVEQPEPAPEPGPVVPTHPADDLQERAHLRPQPPAAPVVPPTIPLPEPVAHPAPAQYWHSEDEIQHQPPVQPMPEPAQRFTEPDPEPQQFSAVAVEEPYRAPAITGTPMTASPTVVSRRELRARQAAAAVANRAPASGGEVLVCMAGKGGVGKSSLALAAAQRAASAGPQGFRVTLVDANRGQGDLRTYLHLVNDNLATIYDAAFTGDASAAHSLPRDLNAARGKGKGYLGFAFVAAPPAECADPSVVTAEVYREVIGHARTVSDLVVVDTQIAEAYDTSAMFTRMLTPMLSSGAWALGISDLSLPGVSNLIERLEALVDQGADPDRVLVAINRAADAQEGTLREIAARFDELGRYLGCIGTDPVLAAEMNLGHPIGDSEMVAPLVDAVLHRITGLEDFDPSREQSVKSSRSSRRQRKSGGLFSRRRAA